MKRTAILMAFVIGFAGMAAATNGQTDQLYRDADELSDLITLIQPDSDNCIEGKPVCEDEYAELAKRLDSALGHTSEEPTKEEIGQLTVVLKETKKTLGEDIKALEEDDRSDKEMLSTLYEAEKHANKALRRANTIGLVDLAKQCPEKCGSEVSQKAQEAKDLNSSRSNKPST